MKLIRALLLSPFLWLALLGLAGAGLITAGVALLAGAGAAFITAGAFVLALANLIRKGLS